MLLFRREFLPAIRSGEKTQTIRLWKRRMVRAGQRSHVPGVGAVHIESVDEIDLDSLTDADAAPDGFATADELRSELRSIYADRIEEGCAAYRIVFRRVESR